MNYLTTTKANKNAVLFVRDGVAVASFPASLNKRIPELEEVEALCEEVVAETKEQGVKVVRVTNGQFEVFKDGNKTKYEIINGCLGMSGNGPNVYLIYADGQVKQSGLTLAKAKKIVAHWLK
jgi:hypothetical protein